MSSSAPSNDPAPQASDDAVGSAIAGMEALLAALESARPETSAPPPAAPADATGTVPPEAEELMEWLRADLAARAFGAEPTPQQALVPVPELPLPSLDLPSTPADVGLDWEPPHEVVVEMRDAYGLHELLGLHDAAFLRNAFRAIMHREPDPGGFDHFRRMLQGGRLTRLEVLSELRESEEGKRVGTRVDGLARVRLSRKLRRVPVLGTVLALFHAFLRLPQMARRIDRLEADLMRSEWDARVRMEAMRQSLHGLEERRAHGMAATRAAFEDVLSGMGQLRAEAVRFQAMEAVLRKWSGIFGERLSELDADMRQQKAARAFVATRAELARAVREGLAAMRAFGELGRRVEGQLGTVALVEAGTKQALLQVSGMESSQKGFTGEVRETIERVARDMRSANERLAREMRKHVRDAAPDAILDSFYAEFEDRFRGTREDIKSRVQVYLDDVRAAVEAAGGAGVLDIGCGRGEWLELLRDHGIAARGVDSNSEMAHRVRGLGLEVVEADALEHLRGLPAASLGAVTGFHVIEHLPFPEIVALFAESLRVLRPGGMVVFETPNPENLVVGAHTFWYDPTHLRPLPPDMMEYLATSQGFARAEVRRLHPFEPWESLGAGPDEEVRSRLNALLYGPRDYAVVAYKA